MCFSGDFINSREKRTRRDGQVDWNIVIALETLKGFLDGHVADVLSEEQRTNQYPDVAQENAESPRSETALDRNAPAEKCGMLHK